MKRLKVAAIALGLALGTSTGWAQEAADAEDFRQPSAENASVYFISPADGDVVSSPVQIQFGLSGMGIAPAGVEWENTGHHHLIVNGDLPPLTDFIPNNETYRHFGGGQTEASIELAPGEHTLQLLLADQDHLPHNPPVYSDKITITVEEAISEE